MKIQVRESMLFKFKIFTVTSYQTRLNTIFFTLIYVNQIEIGFHWRCVSGEACYNCWAHFFPKPYIIFSIFSIQISFYTISSLVWKRKQYWSKQVKLSKSEMWRNKMPIIRWYNTSVTNVPFKRLLEYQWRIVNSLSPVLKKQINLLFE